MFLKKTLENRVVDSIKNLSIQNEEDSSRIHKAKSKSHSNKFQVDFSKEFKKFGDEHIKPEARIAKEYINKLRDPDILELQPIKRWNNSTRPIQQDKMASHELQKTLFEVRHGLKDVNIVKLKEKRIELGTDSRNIYYHGWNNSVLLKKDEKAQLSNRSLDNAFRNTMKTWYNVNQQNKVFGWEMLSPKKHPQEFEYKNPTKVVEEKNERIRDFKKQNIDKREELRKQVKYEFPGASEEKISAIVFKRMGKDLSGDLRSTVTKPWRQHQGIFTNTVHSFFPKNRSHSPRTQLITDRKNKTGQSFYDNQKATLDENRLPNANSNSNIFHNTLRMTNATSMFRQTNAIPKPMFNTTTKFFFDKEENKALQTTQQLPRMNKTSFGKTKFGSNFNDDTTDIYTPMMRTNESFFRNLPSSFNVQSPLLKGRKTEFFPKQKWVKQHFYHTGKFVSLYIKCVD